MFNYINVGILKLSNVNKSIEFLPRIVLFFIKNMLHFRNGINKEIIYI